MAIKLSRVFWAASIALCYPLYSAGQLFLFISKQRKIEFYDLINRYPGEWICAHLLLMLGVVLFIPAYIALCHYLKDTRAYFLAQISALFAVLSSFMLLGQFAIDLTLPP